MKKFLLLTAVLSVTAAVQAQKQNSDSSLLHTNFPKHEIGFSWVSMPTIGIFDNSFAK